MIASSVPVLLILIVVAAAVPRYSTHSDKLWFGTLIPLNENGLVYKKDNVLATNGGM